MSWVVLVFGVLLLLASSSIGLVYGAILVILSLPVCLTDLINSVSFLVIALLTFKIDDLLLILTRGAILFVVAWIILYIIGSTGGQHGKH